MAATHPSTGSDVGHGPSGAYGLVPKQSTHRSLATRVLRVAGLSIGSALLFVLAAVVGVVLHLGTAKARRVAVTEVNAILAPSFKGTIRVERLGGLGLFGLSGADATIDDPTGRPVLVVKGVHVSIATSGAIRSALFEKHGPLTIGLSNVGIESVDARLDTDPDGNLYLMDALAPSKPSPPPDPNDRGMRLDVPRIALTHAWAHGQMAGAPPIDVTLDGFRGALTYAPDVLEADVSQAKIAAHKIVNGADIVGSVLAHVKKPSDAKIHPDATLTWQGTVGAIAESIRAAFVDSKVDAVIDAPAIAPADLRTVWPDSPMDQIATAHIEAHGPLEAIVFGLHAGVGAAGFDANGTASIGDEKKAKVALQAHGIDAHEFAASAPRSDLGLTGDVSGGMSSDGSVSGDVAIAFLGGRVGDNVAPPASIHAAGARAGNDAKGLRANAEIDVAEPGAPTRLTVHAVPKGESSIVDFALTSTAADLDRVPQLEHAVKGSARLDAKGALDLATMMIDADLHAKVNNVTQAQNKITSATLEAKAHGAATAPRIDVTLSAFGIDAGGAHLASANVGATGKATEPHVTVSARGADISDVDAEADVALESGVSLRRLSLTLARAGEQARVTVGRASAVGGTMTVDDAKIEGVGQPLTATVALSPGALRVRAATEGIDLARVGRIAHIEKNLKAGTLAFDTDVDFKRDAARGRLMVDVGHAAVGNVQEIASHVDVTLEGRKVVGKIHGEANGIGTLDIDAQNVQLGGGGPLSAASWRDAWGHLEFDVHTDLGKLAALVPPEDLPVSEARGDVIVQGHVARDDAGDITPDVKLSVNTSGLILAAKTPTARDVDGVLVYEPPAWRIYGIDFVIDGQIDGTRGNAQVLTHALDKKGDLAQVTVILPHFPFADVYHHTGTLAADLRKMPFDVKLAIPERGLGSVPDILKQTYVSGKLKADMTATGTMEVPKVDLTASLTRSRNADHALKLPLDLDLKAHYDGRVATVSAKARSRDKELLDLEAHLQAVAAAFVDGGGAPPPWSASTTVHMTGFPIESITAADDKLVSGKMSGDLSLTGLHENAHADATLSIDELQIGTTAFTAAKMQAKADGKTIDADVRIDQNDGFAETKAHAVASWGAAIAPTLDPSQPLGVELSSKNFRIAAFLPFLESTLDELDGRLDGNTRLELDPKTRGAHLSGDIALSRGTVEAVAGGGEIHNLLANVKFAPDGTITLEKLSGEGMTGRFEGSGSAHLDGTTLQSAKGLISIPSNAPIPLNMGGSEIGNIDGRVEVTENAANNGAGMEVKVTVPHLRVAVPEGSTTNAQALGTADNVRIGAHRGSRNTFVLLPLDPVKKADPPSGKPAAALGIDTNLEDVEVVRGQELKIDLNGRISVKAGEKSKVTGQIKLLPGGMLVVKGKKFTVDHGTVTFVGDDPSNPEIVVKAGWGAPDGTTVYANFVGPLKTGKVTLTSEPQLPQQEIVELLLFGTSDGQQASPQGGGDPADSAVGAAGGEAAQPLNHALGQLGLGAVTTNVDTTESSNPKPEVEVQIARDISIQLAVVLGQPLPGVNPDTALLSVDWRFMTKWTLSSTLGDAGTSIFDLLWQKRY